MYVCIVCMHGGSCSYILLLLLCYNLRNVCLQGVGEVNFRYSGARLCQHLSKNVTQSYNGVTFKNMLLQRCHEEFNVREVYLQQEPSRVCGFTLFLAELFTQLVTTTAQHLEVLGNALCQLVMTLLAQTSDSNLKCAAQVLKVSEILRF